MWKSANEKLIESKSFGNLRESPFTHKELTREEKRSWQSHKKKQPQQQYNLRFLKPESQYVETALSMCVILSETLGYVETRVYVWDILGNYAARDMCI